MPIEGEDPSEGATQENPMYRAYEHMSPEERTVSKNCAI